MKECVLLRAGAIDELAEIFVREGYQRVLFVVDEAAYVACGAAVAVEPALENLTVSRFSGFEPNPKLRDVERGMEIARKLHPDVVVAFGGGTAIDLGKLVGSLSVQQCSAMDIITTKQSLQHKGPPLIAIPTTAGTGSEATHFAVVYVGDTKHSIAHEFLLPDIQIIDSELTHSLPEKITAATGLDALCQAIESIWAVAATDESVALATDAVKLAANNLIQAVNVPSPESRLAMCRASNLAGKAINISKTTAPHALSYALTSLFGIPHGLAVALTLGPLLTYNAAVTERDCADPRGAAHVRSRIATISTMLRAKDAGEARQNFSDIVAQIGCPCTLAEAGITTDSQLQEIARSVNLERLSNNPRVANPALLLELLRAD